MREIKFRVWDKIHNRMFPVSCMALFNEGKVNVYIDGEQRISDINNTLFSHDLELMQFTGLFDKNGKEIWEGDIIECWHEGDFNATRQTCYVSYGDGFWQLDFGSQTFPFGDEKFSEFEVIGNIYENPELLNSAYENNKAGA